MVKGMHRELMTLYVFCYRPITPTLPQTCPAIVFLPMYYRQKRNNAFRSAMADFKKNL